MGALQGRHRCRGAGLARCPGRRRSQPGSVCSAEPAPDVRHREIADQSGRLCRLLRVGCPHAGRAGHRARRARRHADLRRFRHWHGAVRHPHPAADAVSQHRATGCLSRPQPALTKLGSCLSRREARHPRRRAARELTMRLSRREFAAFAGAATLFGPAAARAGAPNIFVPGQNMPANLDPHQILDLGATAYALNVYDNLFRYEDNPAKMQPWLVESHTMSPDGLTWDFKLHHGVKFHDGSELTADDVVYSFQRVLALGKAPAAPFLPILKPGSVTAPDPYSVRFRLERAYGPFFGTLAIVAIVNSRLLKAQEKDGDWAAGWLSSNDAGSGAYRTIPASYVPNEHVDMERFPDHFIGWSDNAEPIKTIECRPTQVT